MFKLGLAFSDEEGFLGSRLALEVETSYWSNDALTSRNAESNRGCALKLLFNPRKANGGLTQRKHSPKKLVAKSGTAKDSAFADAFRLLDAIDAIMHKITSTANATTT